MKIGFIGDTHMGEFFGRLDSNTQIDFRLLDFMNTFDNIIDMFLSKGVETVVLMGDSFDKRNPPPIVMKSFSKCLIRAIERGINKILINVGNHDQQRHISATSVDVFKELKLPAIQVFTEIDHYSVSDHLHLVFLPFKDRRMFDVGTKEEANKILKKQLDEKCAALKGKKILVAHQMLEKQEDSLNGEAYGLNELVLPMSMFDSFNAVISGHQHKPSVIQEKPFIACSGSMDKVSFGERNHQKVTIIMDGNLNYEIIPTKTRNMIEVKLDYTDATHKKTINSKILKDLEEFDSKTPLNDAIVKVSVRVRENDSYFVSQSKIREFIMGKNIKHCSSVFVSSVNVRQLRDNEINETVSAKKAMESFINNLSESANMKEKLIAIADKIIKEVGDK